MGAPTTPIRLARPRRWFGYIQPTIAYWMETEAHVYGFSIAANVLLSFFPFLIVMVSVCQALQWPEAANAIYMAMGQYFPDEVGAFLVRNLRAAIQQRGPVQIGSILLLMFVANGIFEPLEVALNRIWGVTHNRSFLRNQILSMGMILICGALAMFTIVLGSANTLWLESLGFPLPNDGARYVAGWVLRTASLPVTALIIFLVYWMLPNRKVPASLVVLPALCVAVALELAKLVNLMVWPFLRVKLSFEYGPFINSAAIILWSFLASMIVLAGAEWAARYWRKGLKQMEKEDPSLKHKA